MNLFTRYRKIAAVLLSAVLLMTTLPVYAEEAVPEERTEVSENTADDVTVPDTGKAEDNDAEDGEVTDPENVSGFLREEVRELKSMTPGEDYKPREGVFLADNRTEAEEVARSYNAELIGYDYGVATIRFRASTINALNNAAESDDVQKVVEPNYIMEFLDTDEEDEAGTFTDGSDLGIDADDPKGGSEYQYFHEKIRDEGAQKITTGEGIKVFFLDTGVNPLHEDLNVSVYCIPKYNVSPRGVDLNGHGTHVAGILAAIKGNGKGGYGVAPGVSLNSIQVTEDKKFTLSEAITGIRMAITMDADVISMSFGTSGSDSLVLQEVMYSAYKKGIVCVAAAGNDSASAKHYPAALADCIAVGSISKKDKVSAFSNYGSWVDIAAPGGERKTVDADDAIYSTYISKDGTASANSYANIRGTSQATPMVSAVAAMCLAANPELKNNKNSDTVDIIKNILVMTSDGVTYSNPAGTGFIKGLLQADSAVEAAKNMSLTADHTLVDSAGHYGTLLSGYICAGKTVKLKIGGKDGKIEDKKLTKTAVWESSNPSVVTVDKGKVKALKTAADGDRALITASIGEDKLSYVFTVHKKVKKFGYLDGTKVKSKYTINRNAGQSLSTENPMALISDNKAAVFYTSKDFSLSDSSKSKQADGRFTYDITISKKDLQKVKVESSDSNGDPITIVPKQPGKIKVKYRLLDGSGKKFTVIIDVS